MAYKVIKEFADLQDKEHVYRKGDVFPRDGADASEERIEELASHSNKIGVPLIEKVAEPEKPAAGEEKKPSKAKSSTKAEKSPKKANKE